MSDYAELREALAKFKQAVKCPPTTPNIVFGIISATHDLLADYDRVVSEKNEMVARNKLLRNRPDLPLERVTGYDELVAELDRVRSERDNCHISLRELAESMTAKISVLEHKWYPKEDELIRWREFGEFVADYCRRMNFEVTGETRGDQIFSTVTDLLKESSQ